MIIIVGSRHEGNSYNLANKIKQELEKDRIYSEIIVPGNQRIHLCTGCRDCDQNGVCDFTDDMKTNIDKIKNDDTIIFISPVRWNLLSGDLKIFMDRLNPLYCNKGLKDKKAVLITIGAQGKETYSSEAALNSLISFCESAKMNVLLTQQFNHCLNSNDIDNYENDVYKLINNIKNKIKP